MSIAERGLPLDADAIRRLCGISVSELVNRALGVVNDDEDFDEADRAAAITEILAAIEDVTPAGWEEAEWNSLLHALEPRIVTAQNEVPRLPRGAPREPLSDELDEMSRADTAVELEQHGMAVAARARSIAEHIGLGPSLADDG